jgi:hypothetical protein
MAAKEENKTQREQAEAKAKAHLLRPKGEPRSMPKDFFISLVAKGGTDRLLLNPASERVQRMRGFEDTYVDIIDCIVVPRSDDFIGNV